MKSSLIKLARVLSSMGHRNESCRINKIAEEYGRERFDSLEGSSEFEMDYSKPRLQRNKFIEKIVDMKDKVYFVKSLFISGDLNEGGNPLGRRMLRKMSVSNIFKRFDDALVFRAEFYDLTSDEFEYLNQAKGSAENSFREMIDSFYVNPSNPYTTSLQPLYNEEDYEYKLNSSNKASLPDFDQPEIKMIIKSKEKHSSGLRPGSDYSPKYDAIVEFVVLVEDPEVQSNKNTEESRQNIERNRESAKLNKARGFLNSLHSLVQECEDISLNLDPTAPEYQACREVVRGINRFKKEVGISSLSSPSDKEIRHSLEYPGPSGLRGLLYEDEIFEQARDISGAKHFVHKGHELYNLKPR